jgi:hypothetical protein
MKAFVYPEQAASELTILREAADAHRRYGKAAVTPIATRMVAS